MTRVPIGDRWEEDQITIDMLRRADVEKGLNPGQARVPAGDRRGGQFADQGKGTSRKKIANSAPVGRTGFLTEFMKGDAEAADKLAFYMNEIQHRGKEAGKEVIYFLEGSMDKYTEYWGSDHRVEAPTQYFEKSYATIHNHPSSAPPSDDDINTFLLSDSQNLAFVICHNGDTYALKKPAGFDGSQFNKDDRSIRAFWGDTVDYTRESYWAKVDGGMSRDAAAQTVYAKEVLPRIAEHYGLEYSFYWRGEKQ